MGDPLCGILLALEYSKKQYDDGMKVVYEAANNIEAYLLKSRLEYEQILSWITGEYLQGGVGDLQVHGLARVMVTDADAERARRVIRDYESEVYSGLAPIEFVLTGSSRSEMESLFGMLASHPDVCLLAAEGMTITAATAAGASVQQEEAGSIRAGYHKQFRHCRTDAIRGEFNLDYCTNAEAIHCLHNYNPSARIVILVTNESQADYLLSVFHADQVLVLKADDMSRSVVEAVHAVNDFLGIDRKDNVGASGGLLSDLTGSTAGSLPALFRWLRSLLPRGL